MVIPPAVHLDHKDLHSAALVPEAGSSVCVFQVQWR